MSEKVSKESVDYRRAEDAQRCGICTMFRRPNRCTLVLGIIREDDVCNEFKKKRTA